MKTCMRDDGRGYVAQGTSSGMTITVRRCRNWKPAEVIAEGHFQYWGKHYHWISSGVRSRAFQRKMDALTDFTDYAMERATATTWAANPKENQL